MSRRSTPVRFSVLKPAKIANFKIPKRIEIWGELPKEATGKILSRQVIDLMVERYAAEAKPEP